MNGYAFRRKRNCGINTVFEAVESIGIKSCDKIHIDVIKANLTCQIICLNGLERGVASADIFKHSIGKGLRINAYSADIVRKKSV